MPLLSYSKVSHYFHIKERYPYSYPLLSSSICVLTFFPFRFKLFWQHFLIVTVKLPFDYGSLREKSLRDEATLHRYSFAPHASAMPTPSFPWEYWSRINVLQKYIPWSSEFLPWHSKLRIWCYLCSGTCSISGLEQ